MRDYDFTDEFDFFEELEAEMLANLMEEEQAPKAKRKALRRKATARKKKKENRIEAIKKARSLAKTKYKTAWSISKYEQKKRSDRQSTRIALNELYK